MEIKSQLCNQGSASSIEAAGVLNIFKRSIGISYLGDGDMKSFNADNVVVADVYPGYVVKKDECIDMSRKEWGHAYGLIK